MWLVVVTVVAAVDVVVVFVSPYLPLDRLIAACAYLDISSQFMPMRLTGRATESYLDMSSQSMPMWLTGRVTVRSTWT